MSSLSELRCAWERAAHVHLQEPTRLDLYLAERRAWDEYFAAMKRGMP